MSQNKKGSPDREAALKEILSKIPGDDCASQRARMLSAMCETGSITTFEAMRLLDVYDPRPRIFELRAAGHEITTLRRHEQTESGAAHYVGVYVLS
ncbi:helix-turn-helix domain-containing protein [Paraburkholderia graminis]